MKRRDKQAKKKSTNRTRLKYYKKVQSRDEKKIEVAISWYETEKPKHK